MAMKPQKPPRKAFHPPLSVYRPGTTIYSGSIAMLITKTMIEIGGTISYQCIYWDGTQRKSEWLYEEELTTESPKSLFSFKSDTSN